EGEGGRVARDDGQRLLSVRRPGHEQSEQRRASRTEETADSSPSGRGEATGFSPLGRGESTGSLMLAGDASPAPSIVGGTSTEVRDPVPGMRGAPESGQRDVHP